MTAIDPRDRALQAVAPAIMVPRYGALAELQTSGHRFLVASDGLWLDVRRPWLRVRLLVSEATVTLPYGRLAPIIDTPVPIPRSMLREFVEQAQWASPNETAACMAFVESSGHYEWRPLVISSAGVGHVRYGLPALSEGEHLAVDLHSHGELDAFFSAQDDADDAGSVKVAVVVGHCGKDQRPQLRARLCCLGVTVDLPSME